MILDIFSVHIFVKIWSVFFFLEVAWLVGCIEDLRRFSGISAISRLEATEIQVARRGIEPRTCCSASQELNHSATAAPNLEVAITLSFSNFSLSINKMTLKNQKNLRKWIIIYLFSTPMTLWCWKTFIVNISNFYTLDLFSYLKD